MSPTSKKSLLNYMKIDGNINLGKVKVVLATYNGEKWVEEQIRSILVQKSVAINLLVADDNSKDKTIKLIEEKFSTDSRIEVIRRIPGSGSSGANFRNMFKTANLQDSGYVAFADQDDQWHEDKLQRAVSSIAIQGADGYSSSVLAVWNAEKSKILRQNSVERAADQLFEGAGQGCTFVLRADFFKKVQDFCNQNSDVIEKLDFHDWLVYILARAWNKKWYFDPEPSMIYRQHGNNEIGALDGISAIWRRVKLIKNGWYARQLVAACEIYILAGGQNVNCLKLADLFVGLGSRKSWRRRVVLAISVMKHGRRRFTDRCVLAVSALNGWI